MALEERIDFAEDERPAKSELVPVPKRFLGSLPHSREAEEQLISCIYLDGEPILRRCADIGITAQSFHFSGNQVLFEMAVTLLREGKPVEIAVAAEELRDRRQLEQIGGFAFLAEATSRVATTAQASYFLDRVRELDLLRDAIRAATATVEEAQAFTPGSSSIEEFLEKARTQIPKSGRAALMPVRSLFDYTITFDGDQACLLGDRWICRGDSGILAGTSGMGKSSLSIQLALLAAMGRDWFGAKCHKSVRSLIIQAEDSDGDIAEIAASLIHKLKLSPEEVAAAREMVLIVTDRVNRGVRFLSEARKLIEKHQPDILWINPLQAFIDGDITQARDLGAFLREGLNALNKDSKFAIILVHHTTKPATGKDRTDRLWHEVMYDMAGGAELINWARFIISLRPAETEGSFNLVLAKRGARAGVTQKVEHGNVGAFREEIVTTIPLRHCTESIEVPGREKKMRVIFWESGETQAVQGTQTAAGSRKVESRYRFVDIKFTLSKATAADPMALGRIHRGLGPTLAIGKTTLETILLEAVKDGMVCKGDHGYWLPTV